MGPPIQVDFFVSDEEIVETRLSPHDEPGLVWKVSPPCSRLERKIGRWVEQYCVGVDPKEALPVNTSAATPFTRRVLARLSEIPFGTTLSYQELAAEIGNPKACRAVGNACGRNPVPFIIPCHRVLAHGGKLGGFSAGLEIKKRLLRYESVVRRSPH